MAEPMIHVIGIIEPTNSKVVAIPRARMCRVRPGKKSISMIFTPLNEWYRTAATSPSSSRRMKGLW